MSKSVKVVCLTFVISGLTASVPSPAQYLSQGDSSVGKESGARVYERFVEKPESRQELAQIVDALLSRRMRANLLGYEQNPDFGDGLEEVYETFRAALERVEGSRFPIQNTALKTLFLERNEAREVALSDFEHNKSEFLRLYNSTLAVDGFLGSKSPSDIKDAMMAFSVLVYSSSPAQWSAARKKSYFWPVCMKQISSITGKRAEKCEVQITTPRSGQEVGGRVEVEGNAKIPRDHHLWLFARPLRYRSPGVWWPVAEAMVDPETETWQAVAIFGATQDIGDEFDISAVVVAKEQHQRLVDYFAKAVTSGYPPTEMPAVVCFSPPLVVLKSRQ